jgi:hypothetical protein
VMKEPGVLDFMRSAFKLEKVFNMILTGKITDSPDSSIKDKIDPLVSDICKSDVYLTSAARHVLYHGLDLKGLFLEFRMDQPKPVKSKDESKKASSNLSKWREFNNHLFNWAKKDCPSQISLK